MNGLFFVLLFIAGVVSGQEKPEVHAPVGRIRGSIINSRLGRKIYSFRGIRYAEPPVGQRRFQVPVPVTHWNDVFDASEEGPACPNVGRARDEMSEDCLRLNVYSTKLPSGNENSSRPVIVFIHPGGFYGFSGQSKLFGPQYILDKNIVLVTINYRLGSLGFISTGDSLLPGNLGLKDQVAALRWIQRNIAAFGGNPNSVTIVGHSAGSYSLLLHMLSPMSKNLFHKGIGMSAGLTSTKPIPPHQKHLAVKQAELLNCPTNATDVMLACLKSKPVGDYIDTMSNFFEWYGDPILVWMPVIEPEVEGVERFLIDDPFKLIREGKILTEVPLIIGVNKDEFGGVVVLADEAEKRGDRIYEALEANWTTIAPISFLYERGTPKSLHISRELKKFYFGDKPISRETSDGLAHIYADTVIIFPSHRSAQLYARYSKQPVYYYDFTYQGRYSFAKWNDSTPYGVVHHDDLQYLFFMQFMFPFLEPDAPEIPMLERYTSMWTNFAATGEPIPKNDPTFDGVVWEEFDPAKDNYLEINLHPKMKNHLHPERMAAMDRIFPLPPLHSDSKNRKH